MKKRRFSEEQIIAVLKEAEAGAKVLELCRKHGISDATFYNWKTKYAGMTVAELRRLKELEAENAKLKRIVADQALDKAGGIGTEQGRFRLLSGCNECLSQIDVCEVWRLSEAASSGISRDIRIGGHGFYPNELSNSPTRVTGWRKCSSSFSYTDCPNRICFHFPVWRAWSEKMHGQQHTRQFKIIKMIRINVFPCVARRVKVDSPLFQGAHKKRMRP